MNMNMSTSDGNEGKVEQNQVRAQDGFGDKTSDNESYEVKKSLRSDVCCV